MSNANRIHYWQYLTNSEGQPVEGATIEVYLAGTTTKANIFTAESGGTATTSPLTTDENGFFEFWIADINDTNGKGYLTTQKFKIAWSGDTITSGEIDYIDFLSDVDKTTKYQIETIETADWTGSGGMYYYEITHNLANEWPLAIAYNYSTRKSISITVESIDENVIKIWSSTAQNTCVTVIG